MKIINVTDPILDVSKFTEDIPKHNAVVMVYMMEKCPHCENLKPKWETVKKILSNDSKFNNVMMADIDSGVSPMLPLPPVMGFPNIKVLKDDKLTEYTGMREVDPLLSFLRKTVTTPVRTQRRSTARRSTGRTRRSTARRSTGRTRRSTTRRSTTRRSTGRTRRSTGRTRRSTGRRSTRNYSATPRK